MTSNLGSLSERILTFSHYSETVLIGISSSYKFVVEGDSNFECLNGQKRSIRLLSDPNFQAFNKVLIKKFPEQNNDITKHVGFSSFRQQSNEIQLELQHHYESVVCVAEYYEAVMKLITDISQLGSIASTYNFDVIEMLIKVIANMIASLRILSSIENLPTVIMGYGLAFTQVYGTPEPNYGKVASLILEYFEKPLVNLQKNLALFSVWFGTIFESMKGTIDFMNTPIDLIRKENIFNITFSDTASTNIKTLNDDIFQKTIKNTNSLFRNIALCMLVFPSEFSRVTFVDAIKSNFSSQYCTSLYGNIVKTFVTESEIALKGHNKANKHKHIISDASNLNLSKISLIRRERREYLRRQLKHTVLHCRSNPPSIMTKLPTIHSLLAFARDEIKNVFYQAHHATHSKTSRSKETGLELGVLELLYWVFQLRDIVNNASKDITFHFSHQIRSVFHARIKELLQVVTSSQNFSEYVKQLLASMIDIIGSGKQDWAEWRLNFVRLQVVFSITGQIPDPTPEMNEFMSKLHLANLYSTYVDSLKEVMQDATDLHELIYFMDFITHSVESAIASGESLEYIGGCFTLLESCVSSMDNYRCDEANLIVKLAISSVNHILNAISARANSSMESSLTLMILLARQASGNTFFYPKDPKKKNAVIEELAYPGFESKYENMGLLEGLKTNKDTLLKLSKAINPHATIAIAEVTFKPKVFVLDAFTEAIKLFLSKSCYRPSEDGVEIVRPPSVVYREYKAMINHLRPIIESFGIGFDSFLQNIINDLSDDKIFESFSEVKPLNVKASPKKDPTLLNKLGTFSNSQNFIIYYVNWYIEYILANCLNGVFVASYSLNCFVSICSSGIRAEDYTINNEFSSLFDLIGVPGFNYLDSKLLKIAGGFISQLRDFIFANQELFIILKSGPDLSSFDQVLKKVKGFEEISGLVIKIGCLLTLRKQALDVANEKYREIFGYEAKQQQPNFLYQSSDGGDKGLFSTISAIFKSEYDWKFVPFMFGLLYAYFATLQSSCLIPGLDGCKNNANCVSIVYLNISEVIAAHLPSDVQKKSIEEVIIKLQLEMIRESMIWLNKMPGNAESLSVMLLLERFSQESRFLNGTELSTVIPYEVLRLCKKTLYQNVLPVKGRLNITMAAADGLVAEDQ